MVQLSIVDKILKMKESKRLYEIALDMGVSEYPLYCLINNYKKVGERTVRKIENYLEKEGL